MSEQTGLAPTGEGRVRPLLAILALVVAVAALVLAATSFFRLGAVVQNPELHRALVSRVGEDAELRRRLADSVELDEAVHRILLQALMDDGALQDAIVNQVISSGDLDLLIGRGRAAALEAYGTSATFRQAVQAAVAGSGVAGEPALPVVGDMQRALKRYEQQLAALAKEVRDDAGMETVNAMQGQLMQLQTSIAGLSDQVACAVALRDNSPRTFLLKANETTTLPGYDLVVSLSRLRDDQLGTVSISSPEGSINQVNTRVIGNVRLGQPFEIEMGVITYQGVFTFAQNRLFGKAFVGFEIRMLAPVGGSCLPEATGEIPTAS